MDESQIIELLLRIYFLFLLDLLLSFQFLLQLTKLVVQVIFIDINIIVSV